MESWAKSVYSPYSTLASPFFSCDRNPRQSVIGPLELSPVLVHSSTIPFSWLSGVSQLTGSVDQKLAARPSKTTALQFMSIDVQTSISNNHLANLAIVNASNALFPLCRYDNIGPSQGKTYSSTELLHLF